MLRDRVEEGLADLRPGERRVARFLVDERHRVGHLTAARIATELGTSDATVLRTVRALGYDGLADLREAVAAELAPGQDARLAATLHRAAGGPADQLAALVADRAADVVGLADRVPAELLAAAVDVLARSRRIVGVGFGPSAHLAGYLVHLCRRVGRPVATVTATGADLADELLDLRAGDACVVLAYSSRSGTFDAVLDRAEAVGAPVVLVTDVLAVSGRRAPAVVLRSGRGAPGLVASHAATVVVLEALAVGLAAADEPASTEALARFVALRDAVAGGRRR